MASQSYYDTSNYSIPPSSYVQATLQLAPSQPLPPPQPLPSINISFKPIVIPQITKTFDGELFSPFTRAYTSSLSNPPTQIPQSTFLTFLDGLNEVYMANPVFQAAGTTGEIIGFIPMLEIAGVVLETVAEVGSEATSYFRTRAYLKRANEGIFGPVGLQCKVVGFKGLARVLGISEWEIKERMNNLVGNQGALSGGSGSVGVGNLGRNPGQLLLHALWDKVAPLQTTDLPGPSGEKSRLKRWNAAYAAREGRKQNEKLDKKYREAERKQAEKFEKAMKGSREWNEEIAKLERKIEEVSASNNSPEEKEKRFESLTREIEKVRGKRDEKVKEVMGEGDGKVEKLNRENMKKGRKMKFVVVFPLDQSEV